MDDGGPCLLDVINDPLLLQSFLETDSNSICTEHQNGETTSLSVSRRAVLIGCTSDHVTGSSHQLASPSFFPAAALKPSLEPMGFNCLPDTKQSFMGHITLNHSANNTSLGVGVSLVSPMSQQQQQQQYTSHTPSPLQYSPCSQGPPSVHSMPPPSPLQSTRSPLPPHTPSPVPVWSPSPARSVASTVVAMTPMTQVFHNSIAGTNASIVIPTHKMQSQQVVYHQQQTLVSLQQQQLQNMVGSTTGVHLIPSTQAPNVAVNQRVPPSAVRAIQPKQPPQILPKPPNSTPVAKHVNPPAATLPPVPKAVNVGLNTMSASPVMLGQGQPSVFTGPQGTFVFNPFLTGVGQTPFVIQGSLGNVLTLRPPQPTFTHGNGPGGPTLTSSAAQNATLIAALQNPSQNSQALMGQAKGPISGQHTIMIPTSLASSLSGHNFNLAPPVTGFQPAGSGLLSRPNIFLAPRMLGPGSSIQFQQIQTPQGPVTIALTPSQPLSIPQLQAATMPASSIASMPVSNNIPPGGQSFFPLQVPASHPNLAAQLSQTPQHLLAGPAVTFQKPQEQPMLQLPQAGEVACAQPVQLQESPRIAQTSALVITEAASEQKEKKVQETSVKVAKGVNLAELLKEHGIMPEVTPPASPLTLSTDGIKEEPPDHSDPPSPAPPMLLQSATAPVQTQHSHVASSGHQLKLSLTNDGSLVLAHPSAPLVTASLQVQPTEMAAPTPEKSSVLQSTAVSSTTGESKQQAAAATSPTPTALGKRLSVTPTAPVLDIPEDIPTSDVSQPVIPLTVQNLSSSGLVSHIPSSLLNVTALSQQSAVSQAATSFPIVTTVAGSTSINRINHVIVGLQPMCPSAPQNISVTKKKVEDVKLPPVICNTVPKKVETVVGNSFLPAPSSFQASIKNEHVADIAKSKGLESLKNSRIIQQHALATTSAVSNSISRAALICHQLTKDQNAVLKPDVKRPFSSVEDACSRLLGYHVFAARTPSETELAKADEIFENVSQDLLERRRQLINKFHYLMLRESMRTYSTSEGVLIEKFLVEEERSSLETERQLVTEGKELDLPLSTCSRTSNCCSKPEVCLQPEEVLPQAPSKAKEVCKVETPKNCHSKFFSQRPLKRDRAASPIEEDCYSEPSSKKSIKPLKGKGEADLQRHKIKIDHQPELDGSLHQSSSSDEDIMSKIRKELNISPILNEEYEESDVNSPADDSYENATTTSGLADFEPPVARTASPAHNSFTTTTTTRTGHGDVNYDFGAMSASSDWADMYADQDKIYMESEAAVESILDGNNHSSELDLEGIDSLEGPLSSAKPMITHARLAKMNYSQEIMENGGFLKTDIQHAQVQNAIKSILHSSDNRSYFEEGGLVSRALHGGERRLPNVILNHNDDNDDDFQSPDMNADISNEESDPALDEAVRSILL